VVESKRRSLVKSATWRLTALIVLGSISLLITGDWEQVTAITLLYTAVQVGVYFVHERTLDPDSLGPGSPSTGGSSRK
jgi:uncharacterized membrane protein